MCLILLVTSQCLMAYPMDSEAMPSLASIKHGQANNQRIKRNLGLYQQHEIANRLNDEFPANFDDLFMIVPRPNNRKRLIDF